MKTLVGVLQHFNASVHQFTVQRVLLHCTVFTVLTAQCKGATKCPPTVHINASIHIAQDIARCILTKSALYYYYYFFDPLHILPFAHFSSTGSATQCANSAHVYISSASLHCNSATVQQCSNALFALNYNLFHRTALPPILHKCILNVNHLHPTHPYYTLYFVVSCSVQHY